MKINEREFDNYISTVVFKVTETCNLNCPYCFMFNGADKIYENKPKIVTYETIDNVLYGIRNYLDNYPLKEIDFTIHGGEPLLVGKNKLTYLLKELSTIQNIVVNIQSNGTLIDLDFVEIFNKYNVNVGISLDGYEEIQNNSKTKNSKNSYPLIINGINLLQSHLNNNLFKGVLSVINLDADPIKIYRHFLNLNIKSIDFLLPLRNYKNPYNYFGGLKYYEWLKPIFLEYFYSDNDSISIRIFDSIIDLLIGSTEPMCSIRHSALDMINIDTDGSIQLIDDLRICDDGFVELGLNVKSNPIENFFSHQKVHELFLAEKNLPRRCLQCKYLQVCGSGGHAFRYTENNDFSLESIYCADTYELINFIEEHIFE